MPVFTVLFSVAGKLFGWLVRPPVVYIVVALVAALALYGWYAAQVAAATKAGYAHGYTVGQQDGAKAGYAKGTADTTQADEAKLAAERGRAFAILADEKGKQAVIVTDLTARLDAATQAAETARQLASKEVLRYVTPAADARCTVPAGFVYDYNLSVAADPIGVSASQPSNVDAPSGVSLSTVASVAASNNAECVVRGKVIDAWQAWYESNQRLFEATLLQQAGKLDAAPAAP